MDTEADYKSQPLDITGNYANEQYVFDTKAQCEVDASEIRKQRWPSCAEDDNHRCVIR